MTAAANSLIADGETFKTIDSTPRGVGESPVWDAGQQVLYYASILDGEIHVIPAGSGTRQVHRFPSAASALGLCDSGKLVVALQAQVALFDPKTGTSEVLCEIKHPISQMRLNDGKVGPDGAFWVGSMDDRPTKEPIGSLYRVAPDGTCTTITEGLHISNGLAWSPDERTMYHSDSRGLWVDAWDFEPSSGAVSNRRRFVTATDQTGRPDGGACDVDGNYWSAGPSASRINCFSPKGELLDFMTIPNFRPTMPCFGGSDMRTLYITSLTQGLPPELLAANPGAGTLLAIKVRAQGAPVSRFRR
jgi:sugar lactone lactonase YvrE